MLICFCLVLIILQTPYTCPVPPNVAAFAGVKVYVRETSSTLQKLLGLMLAIATINDIPALFCNNPAFLFKKAGLSSYWRIIQ